MHKGFNDLIFNISSKLYKYKEKILYSSFLKSIFYIFIVISLELLLFVISIPIYFSSKELVSKNGYANIKKRKLLTFTLLFLLLLIWGFKISVFIYKYYIDTERYQIEIANSDETEYIETESLVNIIKNKTDNNIKSPIIENVSKDFNNLLIKGTALANNTVLITLTNESFSPNLIIFSERVNEKGKWELNLKDSIIKFPKGNYIAKAVLIDEGKNSISQESNSESFEIAKTQEKSLINIIDDFLNYILITYLFISFLAIILIL